MSDGKHHGTESPAHYAVEYSHGIESLDHIGLGTQELLKEAGVWESVTAFLSHVGVPAVAGLTLAVPILHVLTPVVALALYGRARRKQAATAEEAKKIEAEERAERARIETYLQALSDPQLRSDEARAREQIRYLVAETAKKEDVWEVSRKLDTLLSMRREELRTVERATSSPADFAAFLNALPSVLESSFEELRRVAQATLDSTKEISRAQSTATERLGSVEEDVKGLLDETRGMKLLVEKLTEAVSRDLVSPQPDSETLLAMRRSPHGVATLKRAEVALGMPVFRFFRTVIDEEIVRSVRSSAHIVVQGLPGVGKSVAVGQALEALAPDFDRFVCLRFGQGESVSLASLLERLRSYLPASASTDLAAYFPVDGALEKIIGALSTVRCLFVFDGMDSLPKESSSQLLRSCASHPRASVVSVVRHPTEGEKPGSRVTVPELSFEEARQFVADYSLKYAIEVDPDEALAILPASTWAVPERLTALLAHLIDLPPLPDSLPYAASRLDEENDPILLTIAGLPRPEANALTWLVLFEGVPLRTARESLGAPFDQEFVRPAAALQARNLIQRGQKSYDVPKSVRGAVLQNNPEELREHIRALDIEARKLGLRPDLLRSGELPPALVRVLSNVVALEPSYDLGPFLTADLLDSLNREGAWVVYTDLLRMGLRFAERTGDKPLQLGLALRLVRKSAQMGDLTTARKVMDSVPMPSSEGADRIDYLSHRAIVRSVSEDTPGARSDLLESLDLATKAQDGARRRMLQLQIGNIELRAGNRLEAAERFMDLLEGAGDEIDKIIAEAATNLGLCQFMLGDEEAMDTLNRAIDYAVRCGDRVIEGKAYYHRALAQAAAKPCEGYESARKAAVQIGDSDPRLGRAIGMLVDRLKEACQ